MNHIAQHRTNGNTKPAISNGFCTSLDCIGLCSGGGGGSRTRVRKSSTVASTYVAFDLNLPLKTPKGRINQARSCKNFALPPAGKGGKLSRLNDALADPTGKTNRALAVLCG